MLTKKPKSICTFLNMDIKDEIEAAKMYEEQSKQLSKADAWKLTEIANEEKIHRQELNLIAKRYKCKLK